MQVSKEPVELTVEAAQAGWRLNVFLAHHSTDYSRVRLRRVITAGGVSIDGRGGFRIFYTNSPFATVIAFPPTHTFIFPSFSSALRSKSEGRPIS